MYTYLMLNVTTTESSFPIFALSGSYIFAFVELQTSTTFCKTAKINTHIFLLHVIST